MSIADVALDTLEQVTARLADLDDAVCGTVLSDEVVSLAQLYQGIRRATMSQSAVPILCGSGLLNIGIQSLVDSVVSYLPSAAERGTVQLVQSSRVGGTMERRTLLSRDSGDSAFTGLVFKVMHEERAPSIMCVS